MAIGLSVPEGLKGSWPNFTHYSPARSCTVSTFNSFLLVEFGSCAFSCLFWDSSHFSDKKTYFGSLIFACQKRLAMEGMKFYLDLTRGKKLIQPLKIWIFGDSCTKINSSPCFFQNNNMLIPPKLHMFKNNQEEEKKNKNFSL